MVFFDLFAGIGGFRLPLERLGHTCRGFAEKDPHARATYKINFDTGAEVEWHDITQITDREIAEALEGIDLLTAGFPCQAFSVAGKGRGFDDARGTLFFDVARIAEQVKPRYLLLENVKGLLFHNKGETFARILSTLDELGYDAEWQLLNSADFGIPQSRDRVFIIGHLRTEPFIRVFPITRGNGTVVKQFRGAGNTDGVIPTAVAPVLTPGRKIKRQNGRRFKTFGEPMFTLTGQDIHGVVISNGVAVDIRRLTPLEYFRLQGFPDRFYYLATVAGVKKAQLYKQAGNAVTVPIVEAIAQRLTRQEASQ